MAGLLRIAYHEALDATSVDVTALGSLCSQGLAAAISAFETADAALASGVLADADRAEDLRTRIVATCQELMWRQQPLAGELRRVAGMSEIGEDYGRIAHYIVEIAKHAVRIARLGTLPIPEAIRAMDVETVSLLDRATRSYSERDASLADQVVTHDDEHTDELYALGMTALQRTMEDDPSAVEPGMSVMFVLADLQRISEHAVSVAWHTKRLLAAG